MINEIENLLLKIQSSPPSEKFKYIQQLQDKVWYEANLEDDQMNDLLMDLIYDLDFYEHDEFLRTNFPNDYGDVALTKTIQTALKNITTIKEENMMIEVLILEALELTRLK
jgi:hypothetical protein